MKTASRATPGYVVVVAVAVAVAVVTVAILSTSWVPQPSRGARMVDLTSSLSGVFEPGVILGAGSNSTDTLLAGIGVYHVSPEFSLPVLADVRSVDGGVVVENLTPSVNSVFFEGGTYALGWNGTSWVIGGQATWGGVNDGSMVSLTGRQVTNLTSLIYPYFAGGGIFSLGWNGSAWLVGGNSSEGIALVALSGDRATDLTNLVPDRDPLGWIQLIAWNGMEWVIGGQEVLGTLAGSRYTDLLPGSPYTTSGVYAGAWNGTGWLVGGGSGRVVSIVHDALQPGPTLPTSFDQSALLILPYNGGWVIGGKGSTPDGGIQGSLVRWNGGNPATGLTDLTSLVTSSFTGGEIQGGGWAPEFGATAVLVVGEGDYDRGSGYGIGAMSLLVLP